MSDPWQILAEALEHRAAAGDPARFWLRDDDAALPGPALDRLLALTAGHAVPLLLAVIPSRTGQTLAERLKSAPHVSVAVHGWAHADHAAGQGKRQELGPERPAAAVLAELAQGQARIAGLFGAQALPILVPPWNRIAPALLPDLTALGFAALSVFGPEAAGPLPVINTHVDLIDWRGTRGARPAADLIADILARLDATTAHACTIGLLTHHLVHDAAAWTFLTTLFALTARHPGCRWIGGHDLLAAARPAATPA